MAPASHLEAEKLLGGRAKTPPAHSENITTSIVERKRLRQKSRCEAMAAPEAEMSNRSAVNVGEDAEQGLEQG